MISSLSSLRTITVFASLCAVTACAVPPTSGPTVIALPPQGKSPAVFQQEDQQCRIHAAAVIGFIQPGQAATQAAVGSAAVGTVLGAAAGAAIGAAAGNPGAGAAIGGATGLLGGAAVGANNAAASQFSLQTRYDIAYSQCMYAFGNTVTNPPVAYAYAYPWYGGPWYGSAGWGNPWGGPWNPWGGPWYGWGSPGFVGGGVVIGSSRGFHRFHGSGFRRGGFHGGRHFHH